MNEQLLTEETRKLLAERKGYRDNTMFGGGSIEVDEVCTFETFDLGNTDIPETLLKLYPDELTEAEKEVLRYLSEEEYTDAAEFRSEFASIALRLAQKMTGKEYPVCRWFASFKAVAEYYQQESGDTDSIEAYDIPEKICILSDIGYDGALIAY